MGEFEKVTKRPPTIPNLIINGSDSNNNQLIGNLQKNNVILNNSRRCSTGLLFETPAVGRYGQSCRLNNKQLSSFRQLKKLSRLQNLHYESVGLGLNSFLDSAQNQNIYSQNLKLGLMLRSSLPATPISTPVHGEFKPFTEQILLDRLSRTPPVQRKQWNSSVRVYDSCIKRNSESNSSLNRHLDRHLVPASRLKEDLKHKEDFNLENLSETDINANMNVIFKKMGDLNKGP